MARNTVSVKQIVNDFMLTLHGDDYVNDASGIAVHNYALRGIREMGFDVSKVVKSLLLPVESNGTVVLPDDFVDFVKIGKVGADGLVYVFGQNKNLNQPMKYKKDSNGNVVAPGNDGMHEREDAKVTVNINSDYTEFTFRNFMEQGAGRPLYGIGGGKYSAEFRINLEQNRIELASSGIDEVVVEYIADEARAENPSIHVYIESAIRSYIYYRLIERKSNVPAGEKARARREYFNERRLAKARMNSVTKSEILKTVRSNFKQSPKY